MNAINRSEQFQYFQNKARHYDNIKKMKSMVKDHIDHKYLQTISHNSKDKRRIIPFEKEYQLKYQNENFVNRLFYVLNSPRREVNIQGQYSRYNQFQYNRNFRKLNPHKDQEQRIIRQRNAQIDQKLRKIKPLVGTVNVWKQRHSIQQKYMRNSSRYITPQRSKGSLHISTEKFVPQHYRNFLSKESLNESMNRKTITVSKQHLQKLPFLTRREYGQSPSKSLLSQKSQNNLEVQKQAQAQKQQY